MGGSARAQSILARFPRHLEADTPGKLMGAVVGALAGDLDVVASQLGGVRRARRLAYATESRDLLGLSGLHGLQAQDFAILELRLAAIQALAKALGSPDGSAASLPDVLGLPADVFAPFPSEGGDPAPARARLVAALEVCASYANEVDRMRSRLQSIIALHRAGNGTVEALLGAAASSLDLAVQTIVHVPGQWWHAARCLDAFRLDRPEPPGSHPPITSPSPAIDVVALEENPPRDVQIDPAPRAHGERFRVLRAGFDAVPVAVRIVGIAGRTVAPMLVDVDTGFGVAFAGSVPDASELRFEADGRVRLGDADASGQAFAFRGGVFADAAVPDRRDFVFADAGNPAAHPRSATFPTTLPTGDVFAPGAAAAHPPATLPAIQLAVGETRLAFFTRVAHYGTVTNGDAQPALPFTASGVFDGAVFAADAASRETSPPAAAIGFEWQEAELYAVRVWLPARFAALDHPGEPSVNERVRVALDRHRAAGVHVYVEYQNDQWKPPVGILPENP